DPSVLAKDCTGGVRRVLEVNHHGPARGGNSGHSQKRQNTKRIRPTPSVSRHHKYPQKLAMRNGFISDSNARPRFSNLRPDLAYSAASLCALPFAPRLPIGHERRVLRSRARRIVGRHSTARKVTVNTICYNFVN